MSSVRFTPKMDATSAETNNGKTIRTIKLISSKGLEDASQHQHQQHQHQHQHQQHQQQHQLQQQLQQTFLVERCPVDNQMDYIIEEVEDIEDSITVFISQVVNDPEDNGQIIVLQQQPQRQLPKSKNDDEEYFKDDLIVEEYVEDDEPPTGITESVRIEKIPDLNGDRNEVLMESEEKLDLSDNIIFDDTESFTTEHEMMEPIEDSGNLNERETAVESIDYECETLENLATGAQEILRIGSETEAVIQEVEKSMYNPSAANTIQSMEVIGCDTTTSTTSTSTTTATSMMIDDSEDPRVSADYENEQSSEDKATAQPNEESKALAFSKPTEHKSIIEVRIQNAPRKTESVGENKGNCNEVNPGIIDIEIVKQAVDQVQCNNESEILDRNYSSASTVPEDNETDAQNDSLNDKECLTYELFAPQQLTEDERLLDDKYRGNNEAFLQHLPCFKLYSDPATVPRCRECRSRNGATVTQAQALSNVGHAHNEYCRFFEFRRLRYTDDGKLQVIGFPNPYLDPTQTDLNIWQPDDDTEPTSGFMDIQVCRYILLHVGDLFCHLWKQEAEALQLHENDDKTIAWKKLVKDFREICDVCETTLFNFHWTCSKCGFSTCLDCFKDRKKGRTVRKTLRNASRQPKKYRTLDEFQWLLCTSNEQHELYNLMLTQIIPGDSLNFLGYQLHEVRTLWQIPQMCNCALSKQTMPADSEDLVAFVEDMIKDSQLKQHTSASSLATEETLRHQARLERVHCKKMRFAKSRNIDYDPSQIYKKENLGPDPITTAFDDFKHINFQREGSAGLRRFLPPQTMTMADSVLKAPGVPHEWLCDGKLLRLMSPMHPENRILFQHVWKCGQPVMISEVARALDLRLWHPEAFCIDFGDKPNDLINCLNGNLVPNQPMRYFWEGFQYVNRRLLDHNGKPMLLKLKDWPPGEDFAEIMPKRYKDLMGGLPMPEYTLRTGHLNLASCLPKMFVPPDLGPKMYNAYGSALHPDKGTTNLHLDISDAANIMVYVGIPEDTDTKPLLAASQRAIAMGGCDFFTRYRAQREDVLPGALWHIFAARDADKIRDLLNRVTLESGFRLEPDHDPIHDQNWYLDDKLRARLFREYGVKGYSIVQCLGDAVFIPAGAPHQVQNLHNCIKVAEDFVSPENITHCYHLSHEFRRLSNSHTNHEDKLQIKNIIYHSIKDCCTILMRSLDERVIEAYLDDV